MKIILISFLALLAPILIGILFGFLMKGVNKMKKIFFVLLVCCLVNVLMGCGYTVVRTLSPTEIHKSNVSYKDSGGSDISSLKLLGSECDFLGASSADGSATRNEEKGVAELRSSSDGLSTATYFFDFNQTESLKISVDYQGKGRAIVLYGKSSNDKVVEGVILELPEDKAKLSLSLGDIGQFQNKNGQVEVQVSTDQGNEIIVKMVEVEYLSDKQAVSVVYRDVPYREYVYTPWYYYYNGPIYCWDSYLGCYVVYRSWWQEPWYYSWRTSVVYYYYPSSVYIYCQPRYVYYNPCYYETRTYNYQGRETRFVERKPRPADSRASISSLRANSRSLAVNSSGQENKGQKTYSATSKEVKDARTGLSREIDRVKKSSVRQAPANQSSQTWFGRLADKGRERIVEGGRREVPLKRNEGPTSSGDSVSTRRQGLTEAVQKAASRAREEAQPQRQVQPTQTPAPAPSPSIKNEDDEEKNRATSSSLKVRRSP